MFVIGCFTELENIKPGKKNIEAFVGVRSLCRGQSGVTSTEALISVLCTYARSNIMLSTLQAFLLITCTLASYSLSLPSTNQSEVLDNGRQEGKTRTSGDMNATHLTEVTSSTIDSGGQSINFLTDSTTEGRSKNSSDPLAMMPGSLAGDSLDNNNNNNNKNNKSNNQANTAADPLAVIPASLAENSSDNNNNKSNNQANKEGDPLAMMPESLAENSSENNNKNINNTSHNKADPLAMMPKSLVGAGDKARLWLNQNNQMVISVFIRINVIPQLIRQ